MTDDQHRQHMRAAFETARVGMHGNHGGPFGAVIVKDGQIVARGHNRVVGTNDPTAHAEMVAIRAAAQALDTFDLSGCEIYVNATPCPMCLTAILWARLDKLYYAAHAEDAAAIDFDDAAFYEEVKSWPNGTLLPSEFMADMHGEAKAVLDAWLDKKDRTHY